MNTLNFLDANVWLALFWNRHIHSGEANRWFEENATGQFFYCRFTQMATLRLLTTDGVMGKDVVSMSGAWDLWDEVSADSAFRFCRNRKILTRSFVHGRASLQPLPKFGQMRICWLLRRWPESGL